MNNTNQGRPDLSDVSFFAPEIDFPQWEEDRRKDIGPLSPSGVRMDIPRPTPVQVESARQVLRVVKKTEDYLGDVLAAWYPVKAAQLDDLNLRLSRLAVKIVGETSIDIAQETDYTEMQQEYTNLRVFLASLEHMDVEDSYQEE